MRLKTVTGKAEQLHNLSQMYALNVQDLNEYLTFVALSQFVFFLGRSMTFTKCRILSRMSEISYNFIPVFDDKYMFFS